MSGVELLLQGFRQLGSLLALELRGDLHIALGDGVEDHRDAAGILTTQVDLQEVPVRVHLHAERIAEPARCVPQGR